MKHSMSDHHYPISSSCPEAGRSAFTLIEMLVSAALVVLIMSLFAQIFALATGSMRDQRTISRHDQKVRVVERLLRDDLNAMSFRQIRGAQGLSRGIIPLHPNYPVDERRQRGYWEYSENNPGNDRDDILQFTVDLEDNRLTGTKRDENAPTKYSGLAAAIGGTGSPDQPVADDGNGAALRHASRAAEVSYFLRGGNLYRRVLLLRDAPNDDVRRGQPSLGAGGQAGPILSDTANPLDDGLTAGTVPADYSAALDNSTVTADFNNNGSADAGETQSNYYADFDLAATRYTFDPENDGPGDGDSDMTTADESAIFIHGVDSLCNVGAERPLGQPWNRFGHMPLSPLDVTLPSAATFVPSPGQPFEFLRTGSTGNDEASGSLPIRGAADTTQFIGRFTHAETSFSQFNWPGVSLAGLSPLNRIDLAVQPNSTISSTGSGSNFVGARVGEDLIMSNVHSFDVKIWDDFSQQFVDLGGNGAIYGSGSFSLTKNLTAGAFGFAYGSSYDGTGASRVSAVANNHYDTWHAAVDGMTAVDVNGNSSIDIGEHNVFDNVFDPPPTWASQLNPLVVGDTSGNVNGVVGSAAGQEIAAGSWNTVAEFEGVWDTNNSYQIGDIVVPDRFAQPYVSLSAADTMPLSAIAFRLVGGSDNDGNGVLQTKPLVLGGQQPDWRDGLRYGRVTEFGFDQTPADPLTSEDVLIWAPVFNDDRIGLKKVSITLKIRDPKSDTLRDVTIVHSFVE